MRLRVVFFPIAAWAMTVPPALPASTIWALALIVISLVVWLVLRRTRWAEAAGWLALAIAGQAAALQLLHVGPRIDLQRFHNWPALLHSYRAFFLVLVSVQTAVVMAGAYRRWPAARPVVSRMLTWRRGLVLLALVAFAAITVEPDLVRAFFLVGGRAKWALQFVTHMGLASVLYLVGALNLVLLVAAVPTEHWSRLEPLWRSADGRLPWLCATWVVTVSSILAWGVLERMGHVPDEIAYVFQAKYLSAGRLYLPAPPVPEAFPFQLCLVEGGKWYSVMLGGWPFALAVGYWIGAPWLVNPLLGGLSILLAHALVRRLYGEGLAHASILLLASSPWFLFMSANLMSHSLALVCMLLGLLGVESARRTGHMGWSMLAGLAFGALLHVRPLEAVTLGGIAGVWWLSAGLRQMRWSAVAGAALPGLVMSALYLAYNKALTGDALLPPVTKFFDQTIYTGANRLGFGRDVGNFGWIGLDPLPGHGPLDVLVNTNHNLYMINFELLGWASGSLLFVFLLAALGNILREGLVSFLVLGTWAAASLYWFSGGPDFGARYWYAMIVPLMVLTVRGGQVLAERMRGAGAASDVEPRVWAFAALATLMGLLQILPWRSLDKYPNYRDIRADIRALEDEYKFGRSLVLIRGKQWPDYASAFPFNPSVVDVDSPGTIYAWDAGPQVRDRLAQLYANRPVWILAGPTVTGGAFQVQAGPLATAELMRGSALDPIARGSDGQNPE